MALRDPCATSSTTPGGGASTRSGSSSSTPPRLENAAWTQIETISGHLLGFPGVPCAHSQAESLDELQANLEEVVAMLLEDG